MQTLDLDKLRLLWADPSVRLSARRAAPVVLVLALVFAWGSDGVHRAGRARAASLPLAVTPEVREQIARFTTGRAREATRRAVERSRSMRAEAERAFDDEGLPPELVWLAHVESGWRPDAVSPASAAGAWQFIPATAQRFGLRVSGGADERFDYPKETRAAAKYLRYLYDYYDGNWPLAIGAYNCGERNMDRAIARAGGEKDFWELRRRGLLPKETATYVPRVIAASIVGTDPSRLDDE